MSEIISFEQLRTLVLCLRGSQRSKLVEFLTQAPLRRGLQFRGGHVADYRLLRRAMADL